MKRSGPAACELWARTSHFRARTSHFRARTSHFREGQTPDHKHRLAVYTGSHLPRNLLTVAAALLPLALNACKLPPREAPTQSFSRQEERSKSAAKLRTERGPASSSFDFYLLNLSWSPEFCSTHPGRAECESHPAFVLHGLWPQNQDGTHPEHCSDAPGPADPSLYRDIYPDAGLLRHEWQTHGTCSGLDPGSFFALAREAVQEVTIPRQLTTLRDQVSMPPEAILQLFRSANPSIPRQSFALSCGNNRLTAVEVCFSKDLAPVPCSSVRSCRANTVQIPSP